MNINELFFDPSIKMDAVQTHKTLNPKIWTQDNRLRPEVEVMFKKIAKAFEETLRMGERLPVIDVTIQGSNANYFYSPYSDIDLHIVIDQSKLKTVNEKAAFELFYAKGSQFNSRGINIRGIAVEVFVETEDTNPAAGGIYSLTTGQWLTPPPVVETQRDNPELKLLLQDHIKMIKAALASKDSAIIKRALFKIRRQRRDALNNVDSEDSMSGEVSLDNAAWKILKATGWIDKLYAELDASRNKKLSLPETALNELFDGGPKLRKFNSSLHPDFWNGEKLNSECREQLLKIAYNFVSTLETKLDIQDIQIKGSLANYNYNPDSDIDLNIIAPIADRTIDALLFSKKVLWKTYYSDVNVFGFPVEVSVRDPAAVHSSDGVYSVKNDAWVHKPNPQTKNIDWEAVRTLAKEWHKEALAAKKSNDLKKAKDIRQKIIRTRNRVLDGTVGAEYKTENLAYKAVSNSGIIDDLEEIIRIGRASALSLPR